MHSPMAPKLITKQGNEVVVVLSYAEYRKMKLKQIPLSVFFQEAPLAKNDLDFTRDASGFF